MVKRKSRNITNPEDINELITLKEIDITQSKILSYFGEFDGKCRFYPFDTITIPKNVYGPEGKKNKEPFVTTVGLWIFNVLMIEDRLFDQFKYINETINGSKLDDIISKICLDVMEDKLSVQDLSFFLQKCQWLMPLTTPLTYSVSENIYGLSDYIEPKKKELAKKYAKELEAGDVVVAEKIEKELIAYAEDHLKGDPAMDVFYSKARSSIPNHMKNMYIMKGAVTNPDPTAEKKFDIIMSSLSNGVSKEEYPTLCKSLATGPYSRARKTAIGGYWEKLFVMAYQDIYIGSEKGPKSEQDCGTNQTLEVYLTDKNVKQWMYSYIKEGSKYTELTSDNMNKYIGKKVNFRFSSLCESKTCICHRCAGNSFARLGVKNIGPAMSMIASKIKNIAMKAFHDGTISTIDIDLEKAFGE